MYNNEFKSYERPKKTRLNMTECLNMFDKVEKELNLNSSNLIEYNELSTLKEDLINIKQSIFKSLELLDDKIIYISNKMKDKEIIREKKEFINSNPWRKIKYEMNQEEIRKILGEPNKIKCENYREKWLYHKTHDEGYLFLKEGEIVFKQPGATVIGWIEP